jgi:hypothetical protein
VGWRLPSGEPGIFSFALGSPQVNAKQGFMTMSALIKNFGLNQCLRFNLRQTTAVSRGGSRSFFFTTAALLAISGEAFGGVLSIPHFSQLDSAWAKNRLGTCTTTIAAEGCALTCTAMALAYRGAVVDPGSLNSWLTKNNGYVSGCLIAWGTAANYGNACRLGYAGSGSLPSASNLKSLIDGRYIVIVKSNRFATHFAIIIGYRTTGKTLSDFIYLDPADTSRIERRCDDGWVTTGNSTRLYRY